MSYSTVQPSDINFLDHVSYENKSYPIKAADFVLTPARIASDLRQVKIDGKNFQRSSKPYSVALRIFCGFVAFILVASIIIAVIVKKYEMNDHLTKIEMAAHSIILPPVLETSVSAIVSGTPTPITHTKSPAKSEEESKENVEKESNEKVSKESQKMSSDIATVKIQRAWRRHRNRQNQQNRLHQKGAICSFGRPKSRYPFLITTQEFWLKKWHDMTIEKFLSPEGEAEIDATIKDLIGRKDRRGLRRFASALFGGSFSKFAPSLCPAYMKLVRNFSGKKYEASLLSMEETGVLIKEVYHYLKPKISNFINSTPTHRFFIRDEKEHATPLRSAERAELAHEIGKTRMKNFRITDVFSAHLPDLHHRERVPLSRDQEEEVWIIHGGGFDNICNFLGGRTLGYRLEEGSVPGMQVHPCHSLTDVARNRLLFYAKRGAASSLDRPCIFSARIKAKYLDKAPNSYEAGLRAEFLPHLTNIQLEPLPLTADILGVI